MIGRWPPFRACIAVLQMFERKASAELEAGEKAAGYKRLFPKTSRVRQDGAAAAASSSGWPQQVPPN